MKFLKPKHHIIYLLLPFLLLISCISQSKLTYVSAPKQTYITGSFPNIANETISLVSTNNYFVWLGETAALAETNVDSTGYFQFILNNIESDFYQILSGTNPIIQYDLYVENGDSIFVEQALYGEELYFKIEGKDELKFLEDDYKLLPKDRSFYDKLRSSDFETLASFKIFIDSVAQTRIDAINSNTGIAGKLKTHLINDIKADNAIQILNHLERRNYYMGNEYSYFYPEPSFYSFLDDLSFNEAFCKTKSAKRLANFYLNSQAREAFREKSDSLWWEDNFAWKLDYISSQPKSMWNDLLALSVIQEYPQNLYIDSFFYMIQSFQKKMNTHIFVNQNFELLKKNTAGYFALMPGKPAPNFELPDSTGKLHQLTDFKGKIVYIDFWGTWCYPCIQEIPDALKLQEKYKNEPVVFLYVAMESEDKIEEWKQFIAGKNEQFGELLENKPFPGIHLVAKKQTRNEQIAPYKINMAPTHVLIDHYGNIAKPRADRSDKIAEQIDALLEKM